MTMCVALTATLLGFSLGFPDLASAGPFDRPPAEYGPAISRELRQAGSDLQLRLAECTGISRLECRFVASRVIVVVAGRTKPPRIERVTIAADLLRDDPAVPPQEALADVFTILTATMIVFDPALQPLQRKALATLLADFFHRIGHGEGEGVDARYAVVFDEGANGLLVITVEKKRLR
jgi:hypothetical protein